MPFLNYYLGLQCNEHEPPAKFWVVYLPRKHLSSACDRITCEPARQLWCHTSLTCESGDRIHRSLQLASDIGRLKLAGIGLGPDVRWLLEALTRSLVQSLGWSVKIGQSVGWSVGK